MSWLSNIFRRRDELPRRAVELAERLTQQRITWLKAVAVECSDAERFVGAAGAREANLVTASGIASAFQAVHVLSLAHANNYVTAAEMTRFTTALCTALTNGEVTETWRRTVNLYTERKSREMSEQLLRFSEDMAMAVLGSAPAGMWVGPGLLPLASEFLYRNLGLAAHFFGDESTTRNMADVVNKIQQNDNQHSSADDAASVPEWLEDKAKNAPTLWRLVMDATDLRLRRDYPQVLQATGWDDFRERGVVAGCVALALQLHVDVSGAYRTPVERLMRAALSPGMPDGDAAYEDCARKLREALLELPRSRRHAARHILIALWVFGTISTDDSLIEDPHLVAELAQIFQNESAGYWNSAVAARTGLTL